MIPESDLTELKQKIKEIRVNVKNFVFMLFAFVIFLALTKEAGYYKNIEHLGILKSAVVAYEGIVNPNSEVAVAVNLVNTVQSGNLSDYKVEDVFDRAKVARGDVTTSVTHKLYDSKVGFNNAIMIGGADSGKDLLEYWRGKNNEGLDLFGSFVVGIVTENNPENVAQFIINVNDLGMMPVIRLCLEVQGVCPFKLQENEDDLVDFYTAVSEVLKAKKGEYRAVVTFGPNEPNTSLTETLASFGVPDMGTLVKRGRDAINRTQEFRVVRGGNFFFAPAIFNCTQILTPGSSVEDVLDYMKGRVGYTIPLDQIDTLLCNTYSFPGTDAYEFYKLSGVYDLVATSNHLVTVITETGLFNSLTVPNGDFKPAFLKFCKDDKIEGFNLFRGLKDFPDDPPPKPSPDQQFDLKELLRLAEGCNKGSKKMSLATVSWLNWQGYSALYDSLSSPVSGSGSAGTGTSVNVSSFVGMNEARPVTKTAEIDSDIAYAKSAGMGGYILGLVINPSEVDAAKDFVNKAGSAGFTPIVRLCVEGTCGFNMSQNAESVITFFKELSGKTTSKFIALVGPNEPGTGGGPAGFGEMKSFGLNDYATAVARVNEAAQGLQGQRSKMLLAPGAFNLINPQNNDFEQYKNNGLKANLFDVLLGNAYNLGGTDATAAIDAGVGAYAKQNNLKLILTETGQITGSSLDFGSTLANMCSKYKDVLAGALLFRSASDISNPEPRAFANSPTQYSKDQIKEIINKCGASGSTIGNTGSGSTCSVSLGDVKENEIVFVGDSLTNEMVAGQPGANVSAKFPASGNLGKPGASTYAFATSHPDPISPQNTGIYAGELNSAAANAQYKVAVIMFGANDCGLGESKVNEFKDNLTAIVKKFTETGKKVILSTIPKQDDSKPGGCSLNLVQKYNLAIGQVQSSTGAVLRDASNIAGSLRDAKHYDDAGYVDLANKTKALMGGSGSSSDCGPTVDPAGSVNLPGAVPVAVQDDRDSNFYTGLNSAGLKVKCDGGDCYTKMIGTLDIQMPIKFFVNNSPTGTTRYSFTPVSAQAAAFINNPTLDPLNMYAGKVQLGSYLYPMPGLGSAVNSATQFLKATENDRSLDNFIASSKGSLTEVTLAKLEYEKTNDLTIDNIIGPHTISTFDNSESTAGENNIFAADGEPSSGGLSSISDRTICFNGQCYNKDFGSSNLLKQFLPYDTVKSHPTFVAPKATQASSMKYVNNLDNYISGPEIVVAPEKKVYQKDAKEVCRRYSDRYLTDKGEEGLMVGDDVKSCKYGFQVNPGDGTTAGASDKLWKYEVSYEPLTGRAIYTPVYIQWKCSELFSGHGTNEAGQAIDVPGGPRIPDCDFSNEIFSSPVDIPQGGRGKIIDSRSGQEDAAHLRDGYCYIEPQYKACVTEYSNDGDIFVYTNQYPSIPKGIIPGVYESIDKMYERVQTIMSQRNVKFVIRENIGMTTKVSSKIRDANLPLSSPEDYLYNAQFDSYSKVPSNIFDGKTQLAKSIPIKMQYQYYDWLGYLDVIQEYAVAYVNESSVQGDGVIPNPFFGQGDDPNPGRKYIVAGGISNIALGIRPILTADQFNICKKFTYTDLVAKFNDEDLAFRLCPLDEKLTDSDEVNLITDLADDRFSDKLYDDLCIHGQKVEGRDCSLVCNTGSTGSPGEGGNTGPAPSALGSITLTYPGTNRYGLGQAWGVNNHCGLDYGFPANTPVYAAADGVVVKTGTGCEAVGFRGNQCNYGAGNFVKIQHSITGGPYSVDTNGINPGAIVSNSFWTLYEHFTTVIVSEGQPVHTGDLLGYSGSSGNSSGPHLHFETRHTNCGDCYGSAPIGSCTFDPSTYINGNSSPTEPTPPAPGVDDPFTPIQCTPSCFNTNSSGSGSTGNNPGAANITCPVPSGKCFEGSKLPNSSHKSIYGVDLNSGTNYEIVAPFDGKILRIEVGGDRSAGGFTRCGSGANGGGALWFQGTDGDYKGKTLFFYHVDVAGVSAGANVKKGEHLVKMLMNPPGCGQDNGTDPATGQPRASEHLHIELRPDNYDASKDEGKGEGYPGIDDMMLQAGCDMSISACQISLSNSSSNSGSSGTTTSSNSSCPVLPGDGSDPGTGTTYNSVFGLLEKVESVTGVSKYYLAGILSLESGPELNKSVGNAIKDGTAIYKGNPSDIGNPNPNSAGAVGPMQYICRTWVAYGYPKNYSGSLPCEPWSPGAVGRYYEGVLACVKAIGMNYNDGDVLDPKYIGVGLCAATQTFSFSKNISFDTYSVNDPSSFTNGNPYWAAARAYNCGNLACDAGAWYASSAWGRGNYFKKYWSQYASGEKGSDCSPQPYREWYYYHVDLGIQCVNNNYGAQCTVTTPSDLNRVCGR